jgi:magnesium transporter
VSIALMSVIVFATVLGTFIPLALNKLKIDPAIATGPFITTTNDLLGLAVYFTLGDCCIMCFNSITNNLFNRS